MGATNEAPQPLSERVYRLVRLSEFSGVPEPGPRHSGHWWEAELIVEGMPPDVEGARRGLVLPHDHPYVEVLKEAGRGRRLIKETGSPAERYWHLEVLP